jgi:hypothetical protein
LPGTLHASWRPSSASGFASCSHSPDHEPTVGSSSRALSSCNGAAVVEGSQLVGQVAP